MNNPCRHHPEDECLLRYADGELPNDQTAEVQFHLKACWQCRARLESLERVVNECVRYYQTGVAPNTPPPPREWLDMRAQLANMERTVSRPSLSARVSTVLSAVHRFRKPALTVALTATVALIVFYQLYRAPSARAAELLQRAVSVEKERPVGPHRIEVWSRGRRVSRMIDSVSAIREGSANAGRLSPDDQKELDHLKSLFARANYSWAAPISARSFSSWRSTLHDKRDEVIVQTQPHSADGQLYRVRTTTESSSLVEATIVLRASDLQPIEGNWRFRDAEYVEMSDVSSDHAGEGRTEAPTTQTQQPNQELPTVASTPSIGGVGPADELRVMAALSRIGADLGEPVEVTRGAHEVLVTGIGVEPERQRQIQVALGTLPQVAIRFAEGTLPGPPQSQEPTANIAATANTEQARHWLESQLGSRGAVESFAEDALGLTDAITARAHALLSLAERFPSETEGQLNPPERQILFDLRHDHATALNLKAREFRELLGRTLKNVGSADSTATSAAVRTPTWQMAAQQALAGARDVEKLTAGLIAGTPTDVPLSLIPARLRVRLAEIERLSPSFAALDRNGSRGQSQ